MNRETIIAKTLVKLSSRIQDSIDINPKKIKIFERKKLNDIFRKEGLDGNGRFKKIDEGIQKISSILNENGFELDEIMSSDRFKGDDGRQILHFARKTNDPYAPIKIQNSLITFSWHLMHSKNITDTVKENTYEILAYVS